MKRIWEFITSASQSRTTAFLVILVIGASIPLTVLVAQRQQQYQQQAQELTQTQDIAVKPNNPANANQTFQYVKDGPIVNVTEREKAALDWAKSVAPNGDLSKIDPNSPAYQAMTAAFTDAAQQQKAAAQPPAGAPAAPAAAPANPAAAPAQTTQVCGPCTAWSNVSCGRKGILLTCAPNQMLQLRSCSDPICANTSFEQCVSDPSCSVAAPVVPVVPVVPVTPNTYSSCAAGNGLSSYCDATGSCKWPAGGAASVIPSCINTIESYYRCFSDPNAPLSQYSIPANQICNGTPAPAAAAAAPPAAAQPAAVVPPAVAPPAGTIPLTLSIGLDGVGSVGDRVNGASDRSTKNPRSPIQAIIHISDNKVDVAGGTISGVTLTYDSASGRYNGTANIPTTITGAHDIRIQVPGHLIRKLGVTTGAAQSLTDKNLIAGAIAGNPNLGVVDHSILVACWLKGASDSGCGNHSQDADLNMDGRVDQLDYNLFLREFNGQDGE